MISSASKEKIFDIILADVLKESMEREFAEVDKIAEGEPHKFSLSFERKMRKLIRSIGRKERIKKCADICFKAVVTVSAVFGVIFGGLLTQPDVYAAVQHVFRSVFDKYDKYEYVSDELTVNNFDDSFRLGYVPDGYYLSEGRYSPISVTLTYSNEKSEIEFQYRIAKGFVADFDNEHNSYMSFFSNGIEYHYYESNDNDFDDKLVWYADGYFFGIYAHLSKDELVKIAENLEK